MTKQQKAAAGAALAHIIYGFSFMFSKIALSVTDAFVLLAVRFAVAFLALSILWVSGIIKMNFKGKKLGGLLLMGLFQPLLYFIFEQYGIIYTTSAISGIMIALVPIAAIGLSFIFLREKPSKKQIFFSLLSLLGVILISLTGNSGKNTVLGFLLLVGAVLCAGGFNILSRKLSGDFTPFERTYVMMALGAIGFSVVAVLKLGNGFAPELITACTDFGFITAIFYLSILSSVVAFASYNYATTYLTTAKATSFANITTVVSVLAGVILLCESFTLLQALSCVLILIGVFGVNKN